MLNFTNHLATWASECGRATIQQLQANRFMIKVDGLYLNSEESLFEAKYSAWRRVVANDELANKLR